MQNVIQVFDVELLFKYINTYKKFPINLCLLKSRDDDKKNVEMRGERDSTSHAVVHLCATKTRLKISNIYLSILNGELVDTDSYI